MSTQTNHKQDAIGGIILFVAAVLAIVINNSPMHIYYEMLETVHFTVGLVDKFELDKSLMHWINDGLMAVYFLFVGLEVKREYKGGELSDKSNMIVPAIVAVCGLVIPAFVYIIINFYHGAYMAGWAIPAATDIAFTLGVLALLGNRVPPALRILVVAISIFDDMGAIAVIAIFYTENLNILSLCMGAICTVVLVSCNRFGVKRISVYITIGVIFWICVLKSGVHTTLAGLITALCIPHDFEKYDKSPLINLEHGLQPWIMYIILPIFAFANAGISFAGINFSMLFSPVTLGVIFGLFIGKQLGIFTAIYLFSKTKFFGLGKRLATTQMYGIGLLCGIGFTMSLFIGTLAFDDNDSLNLVKLGVLVGSTLSGTMGYIFLRFTTPKQVFCKHDYKS